MKKITLLIASMVLFQGFSQESPGKLKWYTIEEAEALNAETPKKIFIDVYTDWCGWCKKMDVNTFNHPVISEYLAEYYYPVKLNAEQKDTILFNNHAFVNKNTGKRSSHQFAQAILNGNMSYPTIVFMNEKLELITPVAGYLGPKDFEPILIYFALNKHINGVSYEDFKKSFKSNIQ